MDERHTLRARSARGIAAAAICAGLMASPLPAMAEEAAATAATPEAAPVATVEAASNPASDLAAAQKDQVAAQDAVTNAQNDVSAATAGNKAADENASAAEEAQRSAQASADAAQSAANDAQKNVDAAQSAYNKAAEDAKTGETAQLKDAADAAKSELDAAQKAANDAQAAADTKQQAADAAQKDADDAATALENANADVSQKEQAEKDAQAAANAAANDVSSTKAAKDAADKDRSDAKTSLDNAQSEYNSADAAYQNAANAAQAADQKVSDARAAEDAAKSDLSNAQSRYNTADSSLSAAKTEKTAADTALTNAQAEKTAADAERAAAQKAVDNYSKGSYGYFEKRGDTQALTVFNDASVLGTDKNGAAFNSFTTIGGANDATSLENMKKALDYIKECNGIRTGKGASGVIDGVDSNFGTQPALKVSSYLMAVSQVNANWLSNSGIWGHPSNNGPTWRYSGENIAWTYQDPFIGWFKDEKNNYDTKNGGQTGHYTNIMSSDFAMTGLACNGRYYVQDFDDAEAYFSKSTSVDFDTYYADFMNYYNGKVAADKALAAAKTRLANAEKALTEAQTRKSTADSELQAAQAEYDSAKAALDAAKTAEQKASADLAAAREAAAPLDAKRDEAKTARDAAKTKLDSAQAAYDTAANEVSSADAAYKQAESDKTAKDAALATAKSNLSAAKQAQAEAQAASDAATKKAADTKAEAAAAQDALEKAQADVTEKKTAYDAAQKAYQDALKNDTTLRDAQAALDEANVAKNEADAKLQAAQAQLETAKSANKQAQTDQEAAAKALEEAQKALDAAEADLDAANARLAAARAAWKSATATQELYRLFDPHSGEHLYTTHLEEVQHLVGLGWDWEQAQTMLVPVSGAPVWRLFDPHNGDHPSTTDAHECEVLTTEQGWVYDFDGGAAFHSADASGRPVYRIYDTRAARFGHLFTADANERAVHLAEGGWNDEKIAWYAVDPATLREPAAPKPAAARQAHYAIRYDANGGAGYMKATVAEVGKDAQLSGNAFSRDGYTFKGWNTVANSGSVPYTNGTKVKDLSTQDGSVVPLYAVWDKNVTGPTAAELAQKRLDEAQKAVEAYAKGSYGFFESRGDTQAMNVLTDAGVTGTDESTKNTFLSYTNLGAKDDATSLENMKKSLDFIKEGNSYRTAGDSNLAAMPALKVSSSLMAWAQVNTNWMAGNKSLAHAASNGEEFLAAAEIVAMGYDDPYTGWYQDEKNNYDADNPYSAGSYATLMNKSFGATGFALASNGSSYFAQEFATSNGDAVDFDTYYNSFMEYYNKKLAADKELAAAKANLA